MPQHPVPSTRLFRRPGVTFRAVVLGALIVLAVVASLGASGGQGNGQGTAQAKVSGGISVKLSPSSRSTDQGQSAAFSLTASSLGGFAGPVTFSISGLPAGTTAAWSPSSVVLSSGSSAKVTLTISTSPTTPAGKSDFSVTGSSGSVQSSAEKGQLHVQEVKRSFAISGSLTGPLSPGVSQPLDLQISNPEGKSLAVTNLSVSIAQVVRTAAAVAAGLPCSGADYSISQHSGNYPITVPPGASSLSTLGVPQTGWPRVTMLDTLQLQDGCKGATIELTFSGTGQAN
ncbi:hypothetical protein ACFRJ9_22765 [Paenarthrobacter sp. NPDC056912]|uniref:hypothetical protein n=1 Tax=Paenarthrobacter sp. NPDC056912 TaxID=3345965 RepID=UPI00366C5597